MSVVKVAVDLILIAILVGGVALGILFQTNTSAWDATTVLIWGFVAVIGLAGILIGLLKSAGVKIQM